VELSPEERLRIYEEEKARIEAEGPQKPTLKAQTTLSRRLVRIGIFVASGVVTMAIGAWFGLQQYRLSQLKTKLDESIGRDLGLTETILKTETESTKITYAEIFDLCDKSIQALTNLIVELRGVYPDVPFRFKEELIGYLNAENEFVRSKRDFYRKSLNQSSAWESLAEHVKDTPSNSYGWDYYHDRTRRLRAEVVKAAEEMAGSTDAFWDTYQKVAKEEASIVGKARTAGVRFEPIFGKFAEGNKKAVDSAKENTQSLIAALIKSR
jgi:hypothetical protein